MGKHTPGKWSNTGRVEDHNGCPCVTDHLGLVVAVALDDGRDMDECEANANLIAAAPDLLEALKGAVSTWRADGSESADEIAIYDRCRAALSKAGE